MTALIDALGSRIATTLWLLTAGLRQPRPGPVPVPVRARRTTVTLGR
jgi:hypothetical protein